MNRWLALAISLIACLSAGLLGTFATTQGIPVWYQTLNKPSWNPPNWLFGPVWTLLYVMMGTAAWMIWEASSEQSRGRRTLALMVFAGQLILNALWSWLFFGWRLVGVAAGEIGLLWLMTAATLWIFFKIRKAAGWLLVPYLAWLTFAGALNIAIWRLNS